MTNKANCNRSFQIRTRSSAVAVAANHTAYDVQYSYRPLSGIAMSAWVV